MTQFLQAIVYVVQGVLHRKRKSSTVKVAYAVALNDEFHWWWELTHVF